MDIRIVGETPWVQLEAKVRQVPLLNHRDVFPYAQAAVSLRRVDTHEVNPTTFYVLREKLDIQETLRRAMFEQFGIDTLSLDRGYQIRVGDDVHGLIPPVVEVVTLDAKYSPLNGSGDKGYETPKRIKVPALADGAHRFTVARRLDRPVTVVHISSVPEDHPFYAYPNQWDEVRVEEVVPKVKKMSRREDAYDLYRDFGVLGCGAPRKVVG